MRGCALGEAEEDRVGQLGRHRLAEGEERLLQSDEEQHEADDDIDEADGYPAEVRRAPAQDDDLEEQHDDQQRHDVAHRIEADRRQDDENIYHAVPRSAPALP